MATGKRKRSLTDEEIGLVKAMLSKGMANDHIHFYFNRADRLISSGRIAQIKSGKYGAIVAEVSALEADTFIEFWHARQAAGSGKGPLSPTDEGVLQAMCSVKWAIAGSCIWEKLTRSMRLGLRVAPEFRFADVIKAIAGLANNKGGYIFVGVHDKTFIVEGMA